MALCWLGAWFTGTRRQLASTARSTRHIDDTEDILAALDTAHARLAQSVSGAPPAAADRGSDISADRDPRQ